MKKVNAKVAGCVIGVFAGLVSVSFSSVLAQKQATPPCCIDMWDPGWTERGMWGPDVMEPGRLQRMARHWTFIHGGLPFEYRGLWSPFGQTPNVVKAGAALYQQQCSECHGAQGLGDGDAAKALTPSPALLAYLIQMPMSVDEYLMWTISEGGEQLKTDMPAFKDKLSREDIWKIISYMRAGFPATLPE